MKPVKRIPILMYFLIANFLFNVIVTERIGSNFAMSALSLGRMAKKKDRVRQDEKKTEKDDTSSAKLEIYYQGWVKYFRWLDLPNQPKPSKFYKNEGFQEQEKHNKGSTQSDNWGPMSIPDDKHFFAVVYKNQMNFMTGRENGITKVIDTLNIDFIKAIPEDDNFAGGIKSIGSFSEGSCFEVRTVRSKGLFKMSAETAEPTEGVNEVWMICTDAEKDQKQFMNMLINLKLKKQHENGVYLYAEPKTEEGVKQKDNSVNGMSKSEKSINRPNLGKDDGYWVLLQDWGDCTLKCGGGLQYQQLMCVPPKAGGKPCEGPAVRTRPCNTQPCPQADAVQTNSITKAPNSPDVGQSAPVFKMMAISQRPQRYDKCHIKESDALFVKAVTPSDDLNLLPKIPVRIVMNDKTLSVFLDETLKNNLVSFVLRTTAFTRITGNNRCFRLTGNNDKAQFCQLGNEGAFVEEWDYDFNLFKTQCHKKRSTFDVDGMEMAKLKKEFENKVQGVEAELVQERAEEVREAEQENETVKLRKKVEKAASTTMVALKKEIKLEDMIEKEELAREKQEQEELNVQLETERKKNDCLLKSIKEKELEDQYNSSKLKVESTIQNIQNNAKKDIMERRENLKKKIAELRKRAQRKKHMIQNEIKTIRMEAAQRLQAISKEGDAEKCFNPPEGDTSQESYCQENFADNFAKFEDCKKPTNFCYICCETEFGELHVLQRDKCIYSKCDNPTPKETKTA